MRRSWKIGSGSLDTKHGNEKAAVGAATNSKNNLDKENYKT